MEGNRKLRFKCTPKRGPIAPTRPRHESLLFRRQQWHIWHWGAGRRLLAAFREAHPGANLALQDVVEIRLAERFDAAAIDVAIAPDGSFSAAATNRAALGARRCSPRSQPMAWHPARGRLTATASGQKEVTGGPNGGEGAGHKRREAHA